VPDDEAKDALLEVLWANAVERWADDAVHSAVLDHALKTQALPELAGRYRALLADPEKAPIARKRLDGIVVAATSMLDSLKTPRVEKVPLSITLSAFGVCAFLLLWLAWAMWGKR
jgi:hypothetical protein